MRARRQLAAAVVLAGFGLLKLPLEQNVAESLRRSGMLSQPVDLGLRENLGQMSFAAALGGLRSLVASITYLQAYTEFENVNWGKVDSLFQLTTRLQPNYENYWDEASWHMAFNAASHYQQDTARAPVVRDQLYRHHVQRGIDILNEGLRFLPESGKLWVRLGEIYARRLSEPKRAADCYLRGFQFGALPIYERLAAYELFKAGDDESLRRAFDILKRSYAKDIKTPSVIRHLKLLEEKFAVPPAERIPELMPENGGRQPPRSG